MPQASRPPATSNTTTATTPPALVRHVGAYIDHRGGADRGGARREMVFEPYEGGHVYDRGVDGSECRWARVLVYEPPHRVVFSWDITPSWQIETDPEKTSEVEVRFAAEGPVRTQVELEHRNLDRHGDGWEQMRDAVGSPNGWNLQPFADAARAA